MLYSSKVDGGEIEMRVIGGNKNRRMYVNDQEQFATVVEGQPEGSAVYFGVAIRKEPLKGEGASDKSNILGTDLLWTEVDTDKIGWDTSACLKAIHNLPIAIRPSACVNSGRGLHLYWRLTEPLHDIKQIEQANQVLASLLSCGDSVWDATRILRVPGSLNMKEARPRPCHVVWCYHWQRTDVHELIDQAASHKVLWDGKWISEAKRSERIEARKKDVTDNAHHYAWEDRNKKTNARGLKVWERTAYHGGPGMYGVDEAILLFTAYMYCVRSGEALREKTRVTESTMEQIVRMTVGEVQKIQKRDAPHEHWDWNTEKAAIRKKLDRWAKRWDGGLRAEAEKAYKEKRLSGERVHSEVPRANGGSRNKVGREKSKAA